MIPAYHYNSCPDRLLMPAFGPAAIRDMFDGMSDNCEPAFYSSGKGGSTRSQSDM